MGRKGEVSKSTVSLALRNPHSVLAVLETRPEAVAEISLNSPKPQGAWEEVAEIAARHKISITRQPKTVGKTGRRNRKGNDSGRRTTVAEALVSERLSLPLETLFDQTELSGNRAPLWLALDHVQDPHNVGAIFRTAAFFGVQGIVVTRDQSSPLNATVYDVASGGMEYVPFAVETNLRQVIEKAKKNKLWVLGASEHAAEDVRAVPLDRSWMLIVGNEEKGMRRLTREHCDQLCKLSSLGNIQSLNVSVATASLLTVLTTPAN